MSTYLYEKSYLADVVYGIESMTHGLADHIKSLRVASKCPYDLIGRGLNSEMRSDFSLGQELCRFAQLFLKENEDKRWE